MKRSFNHQGSFDIPIGFALKYLGGLWKMPILWRLSGNILRYGQLKKDLPGVTDKMLAAQLRELEENGLIRRVVYPVVPPKVEYSLTEKGIRAIPVIEVLLKYGEELMKESGI